MLQLGRLHDIIPPTHINTSAPAMAKLLSRFFLLLMVSSYLVTGSAAARPAPGLGHRSLFEIELRASVKITQVSTTDAYAIQSIDFDESCEDFFVENPTDCPKTYNAQSRVAQNSNFRQIGR
ncbi:hypothetical protein MPTK1_4g09940 [Marchantia polymorpha subsp. ruderalis]|uniref:Uncharacterized protein n=2 Tax=Marchantia polymorpha TaxID=3197 RepID=A0AAF6B8A1_MARPO|nr:hypothetical protein MARPO_0132s0037 [Marchantia polymorpha]PTQ29965.1 hypothetical protein MARPO_0132s0037 [Marchantia polymorpha]BBN08234.1 hypothetical protein Mp_4g09940 [Marchantia polymorpha subsp. ruderalis]BBN08235.1 hypothetical protein Mp_4g09940 [Marchantia polymorpha subsp. ruderalis]|eukprot:PTQ29964.1 hypothetical protein MARPO_0132s0037 [Marchantia polymorpha]